MDEKNENVAHKYVNLDYIIFFSEMDEKKTNGKKEIDRKKILKRSVY